jgi:hypothetical protein
MPKPLKNVMHVLGPREVLKQKALELAAEMDESTTEVITRTEGIEETNGTQDNQSDTTIQHTDSTRPRGAGSEDS